MFTGIDGCPHSQSPERFSKCDVQACLSRVVRRPSMRVAFEISQNRTSFFLDAGRTALL